MSRSVFFIMPISGIETARSKSRIVREVARGLGWYAHLPTYDPDAPVFNLNETIRDMQASSLIIADLTSERPSCYYELGLAEALHLKIVAIAERNTEIHQTSIRKEVRIYDDIDDFKKLIKLSLTANSQRPKR